ncbi:MAG: hypothetical protein JWL77_3812 [Chthonomonadaceae bacterium]|nr:hypothetical protein [Chthonomonadaceae bacterium]
MLRCKFTRIWIVLCATLLWAVVGLSRVFAVTYILPQPTHWSDNRQFVLHVDNTRRLLTLQQKKDTRFLPLWSIPYPQGFTPYNAYITDDGRHVVLQDQFSDQGRTTALIFLGPSGSILKSYTLLQFLTLSDLKSAGRYNRSTGWSADGRFFLAFHQTRFACVTPCGTIRCFDVATGSRLAEAMEGKQQIRNEAILRARTLLSSPIEDHRITGIALVGALGDRASLPKLTSLLDFQTPTNDPKTRLDHRVDDERIQYCAASALVALLKEKSAPLLEARLDRIASDSITDWVQLYQKTGRARYSAQILRLMQSHDQIIRMYAIAALLEGGNPALLRQHHAWLTDLYESVRYWAIKDLSEYGSQEDLPLLRAALRDKDDYCELFALRGLIRLRAPELPTLLQRCLHSRKDSWVRQEAKLELARRGDRTQLQGLVDWVRSLRRHPKAVANWPDEEGEVSDVWEILALRRPPGLMTALQAAAKNSHADIQRSATGALAALGDVPARIRLRRFARVGEAEQRASSIHWLALCKDCDSEPFLKIAQQDEDPIVREAALKALKALARKDGKRP